MQINYSDLSQDLPHVLYVIQVPPFTLIFRSALSLIMWITNKNKHGQHQSENLLSGPTLDLNKILH